VQLAGSPSTVISLNVSPELSVAKDEIKTVSFETKVWPDSSFGCPQPGMRDLQDPKEGYLILLGIDDENYFYHGGDRRDPFLCQQPSPEIVITQQAPFNIKKTPTISVPPPRD